VAYTLAESANGRGRDALSIRVPARVKGARVPFTSTSFSAGKIAARCMGM